MIRIESYLLVDMNNSKGRLVDEIYLGRFQKYSELSVPEIAHLADVQREEIAAALAVPGLLDTTLEQSLKSLLAQADHFQEKLQARTYLQEALDDGRVKIGSEIVTGITLQEPMGGGSKTSNFLIEWRNKKYVLRTYVHHPDQLGHEAFFYAAWTAQGVRTPRVEQYTEYPEDKKAVSFMVVEFLEGKQVGELPPEERAEVAKDVGRQLRLMHNTEASGFGKPGRENRRQGAFPAFSDFIKDKLGMRDGRLPEFCSVLISAGLVHEPELLGYIERSVQIVEEYLLRNPKSVLGHSDVKPSNMFIYPKNEVILYDPGCEILPPLYDLAKGMIKTGFQFRGEDSDDWYAQFAQDMKAGYTESTPIDEPILRACLFLSCLDRMSIWPTQERIIKLWEVARQYV